MATDPRLARGPPRTETPPQPPPPPPPAEAPPPKLSYAALDGAGDEETPRQDSTEDKDGFKLRFCTVCASNQNRRVYAPPAMSESFPTLGFHVEIGNRDS